MVGGDSQEISTKITLNCQCRCTPEAQWARSYPKIKSFHGKLSYGAGVSQELRAGQIGWFEVRM